MSKSKDLKRQMRDLGWKSDGAGRWTKQVGTHDEDGRPIIGILSTQQLGAYLEWPAPAGRLAERVSAGAMKSDGAEHREVVQ